MAKTAQKKIDYNSAYAREHCKQYSLSCNKKTDADIIQFLDNLHNKQGLIKKLIRKYMLDENQTK